MPTIREQLHQLIQERANEIVELCQAMVRTPSPDPPGDTRAMAELITAYLKKHGLNCERVEADETKPNLIVHLEGNAPGRHLILNGHMETQPPPDPSLWTFGLYDGTIQDGKLYGLGSGNMKGGLAGLVAAFAVLAKYQAHWPGKLSLVVVSDECSFGPAGARYLVENRPDVIGDAFIGSEPTSPHMISFGEKGLLWMEIVTRGPSGHASHVRRGKNAIIEMAKILSAIDTINDWKRPLPEEVERAVDFSMPPSIYSHPDLFSVQTANVGTIIGGRKINMIADECRARIDFRIPPGITANEIIEFIDKVVRDQPNVSYEILNSWDPNWTDPSETIYRVVAKNAEAARGKRPYAVIGTPASDARLFRFKSIPAVLLGPEEFGRHLVDENIPVKDVADCASIYTLSAYDFLVETR